MMETCLVEKKNLITQALQIARSKTRYERSSVLFAFLVDEFSKGKKPTDEQIVGVLVPHGESKVLYRANPAQHHLRRIQNLKYFCEIL